MKLPPNLAWGRYWSILLALRGGAPALCWGHLGGWYGQAWSGTELPTAQGQVQAWHVLKPRLCLLGAQKRIPVQGLLYLNPPDILLKDCLKVGEERSSRSKTPTSCWRGPWRQALKAHPPRCELSLHVSVCAHRFLSPTLGVSRGPSSVLTEPPVYNWGIWACKPS